MTGNTYIIHIHLIATDTLKEMGVTTSSCEASCWTYCQILKKYVRGVLEWPCIVPRPKCTCVIHMLFNQLLDMPHLWICHTLLGIPRSWEIIAIPNPYHEWGSSGYPRLSAKVDRLSWQRKNAH